MAMCLATGGAGNLAWRVNMDGTFGLFEAALPATLTARAGEPLVFLDATLERDISMDEE
jgi:hypothetical protein